MILVSIEDESEKKISTSTGDLLYSLVCTLFFDKDHVHSLSFNVKL